jgi:hypothetical protein
VSFSWIQACCNPDKILSVHSYVSREMPKLENNCYLSVQKHTTLLARRNKALDEQMVSIEFTFAGLALPNGKKLKDRKNKRYCRPNSRRTYAVSKKPSHNVVHHGDKYIFGCPTHSRTLRMSGCRRNQEVMRSQLNSTSLFTDRACEGEYPAHDPIDTSCTQSPYIRKVRECVGHPAHCQGN